MTEHEMIYRFIKKKVSDNTNITSCTFNDMDNKSMNSLGVYIAGSQVTKDRRLSDGSYIARIAHVVLNYNCLRDKDGIFDGINKLEKLRDIFETLNNNITYFKDGIISNRNDSTEYLNISQIDLLSDIVYLGKNQFEIPGYSLRLRINYIKGGN